MSAREAREARGAATELIKEHPTDVGFAVTSLAWSAVAIAAELAELRKTLEAMAGRG